MSIDPLIAFASSPLGKPSAAPSCVSKAPEKIFAGLLQTAETAALSAEESVRAATSMVHLARMQMLHGLFDFDDESADNLLCLPPVGSRRVELPQPGQNFDQAAALRPAGQESQLTPELASRDEIELLIDRVAKHVSLAPELIRSVVKCESDFRPDAISGAGAAGLMQLMPETAQDLGVKDRLDPLQNLLGGSRYLKQLLEKYDGDLDRTLAAYNWGPGNVDRKGLDNLPQETRDYLLRVKGQLAAGAA